jgi:hypothetical protein
MCFQTGSFALWPERHEFSFCEPYLSEKEAHGVIRSGQARKGSAMDMDRFFSDRTIERYRRLACAATTAIERTKLLGLMAEEEDRHLELENALPRAGKSH